MKLECLIDALSENVTPDTGMVPEGQVMAVAEKFNFGEYDEMPWLDCAGVARHVDACREAFNLPYENVVFYCNDFFFLHAVKTTDGIVHVACWVGDEEHDDRLYRIPTRAMIDFSDPKIVMRLVRDEDYKYQSEQEAIEHLGYIWSSLATFLVILNCKNVEMVMRLCRHPMSNQKIPADRSLSAYTYREVIINQNRKGG